MEKRKVERLENGEWIEIEFKDINIHDMLRFDGVSEYKAISRPYECNSEGLLKVNVV